MLLILHLRHYCCCCCFFKKKLLLKHNQQFIILAISLPCGPISETGQKYTEISLVIPRFIIIPDTRQMVFISKLQNVHTMVRYIPIIISIVRYLNRTVQSLTRSTFRRYPRISSFILPLSLSGRLAFIQMPRFKLHMQKCFCLFERSGEGPIHRDFLASRFARFQNYWEDLHVPWEFSPGLWHQNNSVSRQCIFCLKGLDRVCWQSFMLFCGSQRQSGFVSTQPREGKMRCIVIFLYTIEGNFAGPTTRAHNGANPGFVSFDILFQNHTAVFCCDSVSA